MCDDKVIGFALGVYFDGYERYEVVVMEQTVFSTKVEVEAELRAKIASRQFPSERSELMFDVDPITAKVLNTLMGVRYEVVPVYDFDNYPVAAEVPALLKGDQGRLDGTVGMAFLQHQVAQGLTFPVKG
jgi:hypothetical protein